MTIAEIFKNYKNVAVFGMSTNPAKPAYTVPAYLLSKGYTVFPINPKAETIAGQKVYREIADIPDKIDILNVFRPSEECLSVVEKAVERKKSKGDIEVVWLQEGILNEEAKKLAEANGIEFVQNKCMYKEYVNL